MGQFNFTTKIRTNFCFQIPVEISSCNNLALSTEAIKFSRTLKGEFLQNFILRTRCEQCGFNMASSQDLKISRSSRQAYSALATHPCIFGEKR